MDTGSGMGRKNGPDQHIDQTEDQQGSDKPQYPEVDPMMKSAHVLEKRQVFVSAKFSDR